MLKINLQLFAHKKGMGSTKNGRDSESKRLGVKRADGQFVLAALYALSVWAKTESAPAFILSSSNDFWGGSNTALCYF